MRQRCAIAAYERSVDAYFLVTAMTGAAYLMVSLAAVRFG